MALPEVLEDTVYWCHFFEAVETRKMRKHVIQDPGDPLIPDRPG